MKSFFSEKNSSNFLVFPNLKIFDFLCKTNFTIKVEEVFLRNMIIWYAFYSKFAIFTGFWKKILEKPNFFVRKTQVLYMFEKSYYFSRIRRQICYNFLMKNFQSESSGPMILPGQKNK